MNKKYNISTFIRIIESKIKDVKVIKNKTFKELTTFKIGGKIKCFIEIKTINALLKVMNLIKSCCIDYIILGFGSNMLASDKICNKVVLKISLDKIKKRGNQIICGAGVGLFKLNYFAIKNNLSGLEWSFGIPGSVGGAVKMNAGSFGGEIKDVVKSVYYTDGEKIYKKDKKSLKFGYRKSFFTNNNFIILKVVINLIEKNGLDIKKMCLENFEKRKNAQPYELPSAGSIFKRPENNFAPVLIEKSGLKGKRIGGAEISTKHCGFIVNYNKRATFLNVFKLIKKIKKTVYKKFDVILEEEIIILK